MHPDARTNAPDTDYFFLGDGETSAAIQWSRNDELSPYALLLMHSGTFARKESTLLFHPEFGLSRTMLTVTVDGVRHRPKHEDVHVQWASTDPSDPVVDVRWSAGSVQVTERFFLRGKRVPTHHSTDELVEAHQSYLVRQVLLSTTGSPSTQAADAVVELAFYPNPYVLESYPITTGERKPNQLIAVGKGVRCQVCAIGEGTEDFLFERFISVHRAFNRGTSISPITFLYHASDKGTDLHPLQFSRSDSASSRSEPESDFVARLLLQLDISRIGLKAVISEKGRFDASIWQYGYEWGQDAAMVASAATYAGDVELARRVLARILEGLSNTEGQIAESSRFRDGELAELNANGAVLLALRDYIALSNDLPFLEEYWDRIVAIAELPLRDEHLHSSGIVVGRRDLWERLPWMGLQTGFDTATNVFCCKGLMGAAELAEKRGDDQKRERWREAAERMREAMLRNDRYSCIEEERIIHRRMLDGSVQRTMTNEAGYHDKRYAPYAPTSISESAPRSCDPDSIAALPILYGLIDPESAVAIRTLDHLHEHLWNTTDIGGYARSPIESDPDSPGPWVFPTAWIAETELRAAMFDRAKETTEWLLKMAGHGGSWFEYYGERQSPPFPPTGIIPWAWGQYILLVVRGWMGIEFDTGSIRIAPRMIGFTHVLRIGEQTVSISVDGLARATVNGKDVELTSEGIEIALPIDRDHHVAFSE